MSSTSDHPHNLSAPKADPKSLTIPQPEVAGWKSEACLTKNVLSALKADVPSVSQNWLYDEKGCEIYAGIVALDAYYPPNAEDELLREYMVEIAKNGPKAEERTPDRNGEEVK